jgi:3-dehydroshikimate dehydratase
MKTSIATVSISGSLTEKLHACAAAGFDGVEVFEPDLIASDHSPEEIRCLARRLARLPEIVSTRIAENGR